MILCKTSAGVRLSINKKKTEHRQAMQMRKEKTDIESNEQ